jgi:hypothetical protein
MRRGHAIENQNNVTSRGRLEPAANLYSQCNPLNTFGGVKFDVHSYSAS